MNKIDNKKIILIFIIIVASFIISNLLLNFIYTNSHEEPIDLNRYSTVEVISTDASRVTADINKYTLKNKGDVAIINIKLPEAKRTDAHCIELTTYNCTIDAYYENALIYSAGHNYVVEDKMIGGTYPCIEVPDDAWGKNIIIRLELQEPITLNMNNNIKLYKLIDNKLYFNGSFFLGVYHYIVILFVSFVIAILTILNYKRNIVMKQVALISMFCLAISVWGLTYFGYYNLIFRNNWAWAQAEYMSLFYASSFLSLYAVFKWNSGFMKRFYIIICTCITGFAIVATILNFNTDIHFVQLLPILYVLIVLGGIPLVYSIIKELKNSNYRTKIFNYGFLFMIFSGVADVLRINLEKYEIINVNMNIAIMPIGLVVFVFTTIVFSLIMLLEYLEYDTERKTLLTMAYEDPMTGLANRAGCDVKLTKLDIIKNKNYAIVFMDLNKLKCVNDTYGHEAGDEYIANFASGVKSVFYDVGFCGRLGGDEFIVILEDEKCKNVDAYIDSFNAKLEDINNSGEYKFEISVAIGYAKNEENRNLGVMDIMKLADQKMYENKSERDK
ncbi:MAG: diguanylate cyclase [Peptostreptococcaceae bacterium]|nr:diguanylate cyclase [Peptostreptococcaceae bacterium]